MGSIASYRTGFYVQPSELIVEAELEWRVVACYEVDVVVVVGISSISDRGARVDLATPSPLLGVRLAAAAATYLPTPCVVRQTREGGRGR